jgi:hypothetical protein
MQVQREIRSGQFKNDAISIQLIREFWFFSDPDLVF